MLQPPYLVFAFDVDPSHPAWANIMADVERDFPPLSLLTLGVQNLYAVNVPMNRIPKYFRDVSGYLASKDQQHGGVLRWMVQVCRSAEVSVG